MAVQYAVVKKDGMWCLFQCGQQIRVFDGLEAAAEAARELARLIICPVTPVEVLVQSPTGELQVQPLGTVH
jgi:hypothetical protein